MKRTKLDLGSFEITSGVMLVTDPCYESETWCQHELDNVKKGLWKTYIEQSDEGDWGIRVASIVAHIGDEPTEYDWQIVSSADIGVDSGQAGFFDVEVYRDDSLITGNPMADWGEVKEEGEKWYRHVCEITLGEQSAGVINGGVVSSSGFGDGSYDLYIVVENNEVVATKIMFIEDEGGE